MAAPVVINNTGMQPAIGFTALTEIEDVLRQTQETTETAEEEILMGEAGTTQAVVISDRGLEVGLEGTALTGLTQPEIGAALTADGVAGYVTDSRFRRTATLTRVSLRVKKEDSVAVS